MGLFGFGSSPEKELRKDMAERGMTLENGRLFARGLIADEFNYLVDYLSDGEVRTVQDFAAILKVRPTLLDRLDQELAKPILDEERRSIGHKSAVENARSLRNILFDVYWYCDRCIELKLPLGSGEAK